MKRLFIAVDIVPGDHLKEAFELVRSTLRNEKINWVSPENLHLTLSFLGDTPEDTIPLLSGCLQKKIAGRVKFELTLVSLGVFKNLHDPRVIWMGCMESATFQLIKKEIDQALTEFGYEPERRDFSPHLTLGRIKEMRQLNQLAQLIALSKDVVYQKQMIESIVLYESRLAPVGPVYIEAQRFPLTDA